MRIPWRALALCALTLVAHAASAQTVEYVHTDLLGSPVAMTDANGEVISRTEYAPYGEQLNRPVEDGPGFTGHVADATSGLTYMQQRYYDPVIGRFLSADPVKTSSINGNNFNPYTYANNNPYRFTDPDGRLACTFGERCYVSPFQRDIFKRYSFDSGKGSSERRSTRSIEAALRGQVFHSAIQGDVAATLPGVEVKAERRTRNPFSGNFWRVDLMIRRTENHPWHVFEIKPDTQQSSVYQRTRNLAQLARYVRSLNDGGEQAQVGNWSEFFGSQGQRMVDIGSVKIGPIEVGGSFLYGPGDSESDRGLIYYQTGPSPAVGL